MEITTVNLYYLKNPTRYVVDNVHFTRLMLMMIPFWVLSIWLTIYGVNVILCKLFNILSNLCVEKKEKNCMFRRI